MASIKDIVEENRKEKENYYLHICYKESEDKYDPLINMLWEGWLKDVPEQHMNYEVKSVGQSLSDLQKGITGFLIEVDKEPKPMNESSH